MELQCWLIYSLHLLLITAIKHSDASNKTTPNFDAVNKVSQLTVDTKTTPSLEFATLTKRIRNGNATTAAFVSSISPSTPYSNIPEVNESHVTNVTSGVDDRHLCATNFTDSGAQNLTVSSTNPFFGGKYICFFNFNKMYHIYCESQKKFIFYNLLKISYT